MKVDLKGKVAVITGAAGAIGSMTAKLLAESGAKVVINDLNERRGHEVAGEITKRGYDALFLKGDITNENDIVDLVNTAVREYGSIDILVNNAGVNVGNDKREILYDYDPDAWDFVVNACLDGVYYCCKHAVPVMVRQQRGKIINIGSVAGWRTPLKLQAPYCAAKAQIINLTQAMAIEYAGQGINVNAVVPGSILNTQIQSVIYGSGGVAKSMLAHIPAGHAGTPADIAHAVLYFASDASDYVHGAVINVDGGWAAGYAFDAANI